MSIRDIKQVLDNIEEQIICNVINANLLMRFHTLNTATKFLTILKRLDIIQKTNIVIYSIKNSSERLNLINSFILQNLYPQNIETISFGFDNHFNINIQKDNNNIITDIEFVKVYGEVYNAQQVNMDKIIAQGVNEALKYIKP